MYGLARKSRGLPPNTGKPITADPEYRRIIELLRWYYTRYAGGL
jgi:hypothetical protein